eukprot:m.76856 g.76856  ORF g.76856 m.76856 type:complete len:473 (+) comp13196_c0_seq1:1319-2737(+)
MDGEKQHLLTPTREYRTYPARFYILLSFSMLSFFQSLVWLTYSPIADQAEKYYGISEATTELLLNWGAIIYVATVPAVMFISNLKNGMRISVLLAAFMISFATFLRCIPSFAPGYFFEGGWSDTDGRSSVATFALSLVHIAQIINAAAGPLVCATVTLVSSTWFPINERTTATAVAVLFNNFGAAIGFIMMPQIVVGFRDMPTLLYVHAACGFASLLSILAYFPNAPPTPPSPAAQEEGCHQGQTFKEFLKDSRAAMSCVPFMLIANGYGLMSGVFNAWSGILSSILSGQYDDNQAGWFSFASTIAAIIGGLLIGPVADRLPVVQRNFKATLLILLVFCFLCFVWFTLSFPVSGVPAVLPSNFWTVAGSITLSGTFMGATYPLFYEFSVELTYPVREATSAGVLTFFTNIWSLVFLFLAPALPHDIVNTLMALAAALCLLLVACARESYRRRAFEQRCVHQRIDINNVVDQH